MSVLYPGYRIGNMHIIQMKVKLPIILLAIYYVLYIIYFTTFILMENRHHIFWWWIWNIFMIKHVFRLQFYNYFTSCNIISIPWALKWSNPPINLMPPEQVTLSWASCQIRRMARCACAGNAGNVFPATDFKRNRGLATPTCFTARAWRTCRDACRDR